MVFCNFMFDETKLENDYNRELSKLQSDHEKEEIWLQETSKKQMEAVEKKHEEDVKKEEELFAVNQETLTQQLMQAKTEYGTSAQQLRQLHQTTYQQQAQGSRLQQGHQQIVGKFTTDIRQAQHMLDEAKARVEVLKRQTGETPAYNPAPSQPLQPTPTYNQAPQGQAYNRAPPTTGYGQPPQYQNQYPYAK